jgi:hypothetical protein
MAVEVRDTGWVDSRSMFYRRGYYQRDAYRANGDRVWVTGDYRWEVDEVRRWLMKEARRANLRMTLSLRNLALLRRTVRRLP